MEMEVDEKTLEREVQRVFKKLGGICCDVMSHLWIIKTLDDGFKEMTGRNISTDY